MKGFLSKNINKVKLTLTTKCNLSCPYCFVNKTNEDMGWGVAKKAINILIKSKGKDKLLSLYGGEPLLKFNLIEKICPYTIDLAKKNNKNHTISICTNSTLLKEKHLDLFNKYNVKVIVSLAGERKIHDKERIFNNKGTYDVVKNKLPNIFKTLKKDYIGVSFCVFPKSVKNLEKNFLHLINLGFNYVNFEIIREYSQWNRKDIELFYSNYKKVVGHIVKEINNKKFIFINPINWEIARAHFSKTQCPFNYLLEVYPNGDMAFSPFLLNDEDKERYLIGNLDKREQYKFNSCCFSHENRACKGCISDYFGSCKSDFGANMVHKSYLKLSLNVAKYILRKAKSNQKFKDYVSKIKKDICF